MSITAPGLGRHLKKLKRKISHHRRIYNTTLVTVPQIRRLDVIRFRYQNVKVYDKTPLLYVTARRGKHIEGFNLNYLHEYQVQKLLQEKTIKTSMHTLSKYKKTHYDMFKVAFRTYVKIDVLKPEIVQYDTDEAIRQRALLRKQTEEEVSTTAARLAEEKTRIIQDTNTKNRDNIK